MEHAGVPGTWAGLVRDLAAEFPDRALDEGAPDRRELPDDAEVDRVRAFEEDVLLRRCYEHVSGGLAREGLRTIPWDRQLEAADLFKDEVARVDPELGERPAVVAGRRPVLDDALEYDRQGIELRAPLPRPDRRHGHHAGVAARSSPSTPTATRTCAVCGSDVGWRGSSSRSGTGTGCPTCWWR